MFDTLTALKVRGITRCTQMRIALNRPADRQGGFCGELSFSLMWNNDHFVFIRFPSTRRREPLFPSCG